jgi:rod shape-determining protein MreD
MIFIRIGRLFGILLLGLLGQMVMLPEAIAPWRPLWLPLLLGYAAMIHPDLPIVFTGFLFGLATDVLLDAPLGQHALALVGLGYGVLRLRPTLVLMPLWQVTLVLCPVWLLYEFALFWLDGLAKHPADSMLRWGPAAATTVAWPLVVAVLDTMRMQRRVRRRLSASI